MDKRQLTAIIQSVFKTLTPESVLIFKAEDDLLGVRIVSKSFEGMTFSDRFKQLSDLIELRNPEELEPFVFIFEAFTPAESSLLQIEDESSRSVNATSDSKKSALPLEG